VVSGFALIWHIWWLAIVGLVGAAIILVTFGWRERVPLEISAAQLAADDGARRQVMVTG